MALEVVLDHISKKVGEKTILNDISLVIHPGEFLTLVGPSGCGKSTLLRVISGLTDFTAGEVRINGKDVSTLAPRERNLAMVFQSYALYPHMTVEENIATPLRMSELSAWERLPVIGSFLAARSGKNQRIHEQVQTAARQVELMNYLKNRPAQLSGGQRQRVAIARAIVKNPGAFLMDEPLSNLDARLRVHMRGEIARLHQRLGSTFIYVTHDQVEAMTLSTRIALMMEGHLLQVGSPEQLFEQPASTKVARFIGSPEINLLPAEIKAGRVMLGDIPLPIKTKAANGAAQIGIRAQRVRYGANDPRHLTLTMKVDREEVLGEDVLLYGETLTGAQSTAFVVRLPIADSERARRDTCGFEKPLQLQADAQKVLVFDSHAQLALTQCEAA